ncbi:ribonuclease H1 small subunit, partial [Eremomyces bilateralis CBS 781.70]
QPSSNPSKKCTPHILPCRVHHHGAIAATTRHWNPREDALAASPSGVSKQRTHTAYFRGRKLKGTKVDVPEGYKAGVILRRSSEPIQEPAGEESDEEDAAGETYPVREEGSFDGFMVWGHDVLPDPVEDTYIRGVDEWIGFAEAM